MYYHLFIIFLINSCKSSFFNYSHFFFFFLLAYAFLRLENLTVTHGEHVQFRCQFSRNFSPKENIIQWKKLRINDDDLIISINGKIPKTLEKILSNRFNKSI